MTASHFFPQEIIRKKRDGGLLGNDEIDFFIAGLTDGSITDAQVAAFAMAVFWRGLSRAERVTMTQAMMRSGHMLDWSGLPGPALDKHSTGGVGDKVSLILAPLVAACGGYVPMISGRGLGHSGGTLDKLEAIPGYNATPDTDTFQRVVTEIGAAIIGQTDALAPADRRLYAIRDASGIVELVPLITTSILAKKLAAGLNGLVMDVKFGSGAFMTSFDQALELADAIVDTAFGADLPTVALLTDMDQPLGHSAGNAVEVIELIEFLTGIRRDARLSEVTLSLAAELLVLGQLAANVEDARSRLERALDSGAAAERFQRMVAALGGASDLLEHPDRLAPAPVIKPAWPDHDGFVAAIETRSVGLAVMALGGGRRRADDKIDPAVGLTEIAGIGAAIAKDRPLAMVHARSIEDADAVADMLRLAYKIADTAPAPGPVVRAQRG